MPLCDRDGLTVRATLVWCGTGARALGRAPEHLLGVGSASVSCSRIELLHRRAVGGATELTEHRATDVDDRWTLPTKTPQKATMLKASRYRVVPAAYAA